MPASNDADITPQGSLRRRRDPHPRQLGNDVKRARRTDDASMWGTPPCPLVGPRPEHPAGWPQARGISHAPIFAAVAERRAGLPTHAAGRPRGARTTASSGPTNAFPRPSEIIETRAAKRNYSPDQRQASVAPITQAGPGHHHEGDRAGPSTGWRPSRQCSPTPPPKIASTVPKSELRIPVSSDPGTVLTIKLATWRCTVPTLPKRQAGPGSERATLGSPGVRRAIGFLRVRTPKIPPDHRGLSALPTPATIRRRLWPRPGQP